MKEMVKCPAGNECNQTINTFVYSLSYSYVLGAGGPSKYHIAREVNNNSFGELIGSLVPWCACVSDGEDPRVQGNQHRAARAHRSLIVEAFGCLRGHPQH